MLAAGLDHTNAFGMAWWIWVLAATCGWFGVSVAIGGLWAALHRHAPITHERTRLLLRAPIGSSRLSRTADPQDRQKCRHGALSRTT
jgi:hypothetical protein